MAALFVLTNSAMSKIAVFLPFLWLTACGGGTPPAENPESGSEAKSDATAAKESSATDAPGESEAQPPEAAEGKKPGAKAAADSAAKPATAAKPARSPQEILTAPDVMFMFSFNDSDVKQAADAKCTAQSGNDPKKTNACMAKARKAVDVDGYQFLEKDGKFWWLTLRTQGQIVHTIHKYEIDFGPEKEGSVEIKPKGKDLGSGHGRTPTSVTIQVPNEYQLAINDPKLGKLVYEAKIAMPNK